MTEQGHEQSTKIKVGSIHADARRLEDPVHVLTGNGEKRTIPQGTKVLRVDFMPSGGKRNPPRTQEVVQTTHGPKKVSKIDLAEATKRLKELLLDIPRFARMFHKDSTMRSLEWVVGEANGPMARIALKRLGFIPATTTEPRSPEEYEAARQVGTKSVTMAMPMADFLHLEERVDEIAGTLNKREQSQKSS